MSEVRAGQALPGLEVAVTPRVVIMGASASRDWQPQHHDHRWAVERVGTKDVFLNTPHLAGYLERYLTDWAGPRGRVGRLRFRMRRSICAGDTMTLRGTVSDLTTDEAGCTWADVELTIGLGDETAVEAAARIAVPAGPGDNPWAREGDDWRP